MMQWANVNPDFNGLLPTVEYVQIISYKTA